MSRLAGLSLLLVGGLAFADTAEPPASTAKTEEAAPAAKSSKFPLRVVKILSDSEQALLFDKAKGRHILVEVGDVVGDYTIDAIDGDTVILKGREVPVEIVLTASEAPAKQAPKKVAAKKETAPEDPYDAPEAAKPVEQPADPYAETDEPSDETPIVATHWGEPPAVVEAPAPAEEKKPEPPKATEPAKLSKKEVNAALLDFSVLVASVDGAFTKDGLKLEKIQAGSIFAKAGLLVGDVIISIDGKPMKNIDDAADLYARAGSLKNSTVQILRAGKPQTLRVAIQ